MQHCRQVTNHSDLGDGDSLCLNFVVCNCHVIRANSYRIIRKLVRWKFVISNWFKFNSCDGGFPAAAWEYWVRNGLVTGANYGDSQVCLIALLQSSDFFYFFRFVYFVYFTNYFSVCISGTLQTFKTHLRYLVFICAPSKMEEYILCSYWQWI